MMGRIQKWFRIVWPRADQRRRVLAAYGALRQSPEMLADIALRGSAWRTTHTPNDPYTTAFNEGRRSLALEILELAQMPADKLVRLVDPNPERTDQ